MVGALRLDVPPPGEVLGRLELAVLHHFWRFDRRQILAQERPDPPERSRSFSWESSSPAGFVPARCPGSRALSLGFMIPCLLRWNVLLGKHRASERQSPTRSWRHRRSAHRVATLGDCPNRSRFVRKPQLPGVSLIACHLGSPTRSSR
jgi:hypothetical protein